VKETYRMSQEQKFQGDPAEMRGWNQYIYHHQFVCFALAVLGGVLCSPLVTGTEERLLSVLLCNWQHCTSTSTSTTSTREPSTRANCSTVPGIPFQRC
jgi:hypothetical protein